MHDSRGHGLREQNLVSVSSPSHGCPPYVCGMRMSRVRITLCTPQVPAHGDHSVHSAHTQSSVRGQHKVLVIPVTSHIDSLV